VVVIKNLNRCIVDENYVYLKSVLDKEEDWKWREVEVEANGG